MFENAKKASILCPQNPIAALMTSTYYFLKAISFMPEDAEKAIELNPSCPDAQMRLVKNDSHRRFCKFN